MELTVDNMQEGYLHLVKLARTGQRVAPRGIPIREWSGVSLRLTRPEYGTPVGVGRKLNTALASAETTQLIAGISDARQLMRITPAFERFTSGDQLLGAYGPRLYYQIPQIIRTLSTDSDSRQATATIWRDDDLMRENPDVPCTVSLHWLVRNGQLHQFVNMRSNDVWLGVPYDVTMFTRLQLTLAWALGVDVGTYYHNVVSFHIYESDLERADALHEPSELKPSPIPGFFTDLHDTFPGERSAQTALNRWLRARHFAKICMLDVPTNQELPVNVRFHHDRLAPYKTDGLLCQTCRYVLPRTETYFNSYNTTNVRGSRCKACGKQKALAPRLNDSRYTLKARCATYGVTVEWYDEQVKRQGGVCAICRREPNNGRWKDFVIDHDHETGAVRGLLCAPCNNGLGLLGDNAEGLKVALNYLNGGTT